MADKNRPSLLDVIKIDGRLAQVSPSENDVVFLDEVVKSGKRHHHRINWGDYDFLGRDTRMDGICVRDLMNSRKINLGQYMAVHHSAEQRKNPDLRGEVTYFGEYKSLATIQTRDDR